MGEKPGQKWIEAKVESALKRAERKERNLAEEFRQWLTLQEGYIRPYKCLHVLTTPYKRGKRITSMSLPIG